MKRFAFLDQVLAEARGNLRVQLCLVNWWRDTGGVTQYLRWAGVDGADDDKQPFGINVEKAMQFIRTRLPALYRARRKIATLTAIGYRNPYKDDPAIFGYELINEAQSLTGRWEERGDHGWLR
jgi:endo-1,4-beta-mannosidase